MRIGDRIKTAILEPVFDTKTGDPVLDPTTGRQKTTRVQVPQVIISEPVRVAGNINPATGQPYQNFMAQVVVKREDGRLYSRQENLNFSFPRHGAPVVGLDCTEDGTVLTIDELTDLLVAQQFDRLEASQATRGALTINIG